ncbi:hypothetical protein [Burkholderia phage vB_BpP_HN03]|uniref:Uncharacterized protein n=1 Tax=Burkholderia phage vB_BpP_HN02 TaxID=3116925 RepID=A0AAX4JGY7_9CAUD
MVRALFIGALLLVVVSVLATAITVIAPYIAIAVVLAALIWWLAPSDK